MIVGSGVPVFDPTDEDLSAGAPVFISASMRWRVSFSISGSFKSIFLRSAASVT